MQLTLDLIVKHGEVECQAESNGVGGRHVLRGEGCIFIRRGGVLDGLGALLALSYLCQVPVVVTFHLLVKYLRDGATDRALKGANLKLPCTGWT